MLKDVVDVKAGAPYRLHIVFEDGVAGEVDLTELISFTGVFEPLRDPGFFARVRMAADLGTVVWPNGADLDPDVPYARVSGEAIETEGMGAMGRRLYDGDAPCSVGSSLAEASEPSSWGDKTPQGGGDRDESSQ